jgi:hypothetical protein
MLLISAGSVSGAETAGVIKTLTGTATVHRGMVSIATSVGQHVQQGDRISTSSDSYVGITLHDDTLLTVGPRSEMLIREFDFDPSSYVGGLAISFLKGTARVVTGIIAKNAPQRVHFSTPTATIGIRGTDLIVDLDERE